MRNRGGRRRGDPNLAPDLKALVEKIGANKLAPDVTTEEKHYSRSLRFRRLIQEFLIENDGSTWANLTELNARAGNYAGCSSVTAARWVFQMTRVGAPCELVEDVDHFILYRRGKRETNVVREVRT